MRKARVHGQGDCPGTLVRVYQRPDRAGTTMPIGYVCDVCRTFLPDEVPPVSIEDLRPAVEAVAAEVSTMVLDRAVHERFMGIVQQSPSLVTAAQTNNPLLNGVRRWWSIATASTLRRHVDSGYPGALRSIVEALATQDPNRAPTYLADLEQLEAVSKRFRPYFNALFQRTDSGAAPMLTFAELGDTVEVVRAIAERAYAAVTNVSYSMDPAVQFDWTAIFKEPWLRDNMQMAYDLGTPGVPFDALAISAGEQQAQAMLEPTVQFHQSGRAHIELKNVGALKALDARLFLPNARTVIDVDELDVQQSVASIIVPSELGLGAAQVVIEFADLRGHVFREYADISLSNLQIRRLTGPYLVKGRIVQPALGYAVG